MAGERAETLRTSELVRVPARGSPGNPLASSRVRKSLGIDPLATQDLTPDQAVRSRKETP